MNPVSGRMLMGMSLLLIGAGAQGAITCSGSSPGFSAYYVVADPTNITQSTVTVTCTRGSPADAPSVNYDIAVNNGVNNGGSDPNMVRRATGGGNVANKISYDTYKDSGCTTLWTGTGTGRISGTINFPGTGSFSKSTSWWGCVPSGQTGKNSGNFVDTVTMTLTISAGTVVGAPFTFSASVFHPASCTISPVPGNIVFAYTSFAAAPATASTTFGANCTNSMPYTMALDAYGGTLLGLNYTLLLNGGVLSSTGTGSVQTIAIDGTIAAGQSGTCATPTCSGTQARTLTITY